MSFNGASINKLNGGLGRTVDTDRTIVLLGGMTLGGDLAYNTVYELLDINTAEGLGITQTTDDTNGELIHYHLSEMFRLAPGQKFWFIPVNKTTTVSALVDDGDLKAAIRSIPNVNVIGIAGLGTQVANALADALTLQGMVNDFASEHLLIDGVFVEGVGGVAELAIAEYDDLRTLDAPSITYVIAQDPAIAALNDAYKLRAAVGTALGSVAVRRIHEDVGSVDIEEKPSDRRGQENYSLSDGLLGRWLSAALSDGKPFSSLTLAEQKSLTEKGWMYVGSFADYPGFYFSGCPTAVSIVSDYAYFNFNCIWNKAARIIRRTLIPKVRSKVPKDPATGQIKSTWVKAREGEILFALGAMEAAGNIDGADIYINPAQAPTESTPLSVKGRLVVGDVVHEFDVDLGLTNKL